MQISTHTLTWSVTSTIKNDYHGSMDFNSHAHVERDLLNRVINMFTWISTHTLTWSVT